MRKDVRMGFAVGGVLLAVLVVAILVFHRGKNTDKAVAFDSSGKSAVSTGSDQPAGDPVGPQDGATAAPAQLTPPAVPAAGSGNLASENKPSPVAAADTKTGNRWDELFASTDADPIKSHLTSDAGRQKNNSRKHRSDGTNADLTDRHDAAGTPAVANAPIETNSGSTLDTSAARTAGAERLTSRTPRESSRTHVVSTGETFVSIARAVYGDGRYYQALIDANPSIDPGKLKPGMTIQVPPDSQVKQSSGKSSKSAASSSKTSDGKTYTVQSGDSLYKISKKLYGTGEKSDALYEANKQTIGPDSTRLKIGMVLTLPEAPTAK